VPVSLRAGMECALWRPVRLDGPILLKSNNWSGFGKDESYEAFAYVATRGRTMQVRRDA